MITEKEIIKLVQDCKLHLGGENRVAIFIVKIKEIATEETKRREKLFEEMMEELLSENEFVIQSTSNNTRIMQGIDKPFGVAGDTISPTHEYKKLRSAMKKAASWSGY